MDSAAAVLKAVVNRLLSDEAVAGHVQDRVFNDVQQGAAFPYIVVGISGQPFDTADFSGDLHTVRLQIFSQENSSAPALLIRKACFDCLDRQEEALTLDVGKVVYIQKGFTTCFKEDEGSTWQAVGELEVAVWSAEISNLFVVTDYEAPVTDLGEIVSCMAA